jgi:pimeloyl-ACP methyl ester carboxylesterase
VVVLAITALVAVALLARSAGTYHAANAAAKFPPEVRRAIVFGVAFNLAVAPALLAAWAFEVVATPVRIARRRPAGRALGRLGVASLPLVVMAVGHRVLNPWLPGVLRQAWTMVSGGGAA